MNKQKTKARKKRIILLEDEEVLAKLYQKKLIDSGFDVEIFKTSDDLLNALDKFNPDLAFLDYALNENGETGISVISELKKHNPKIKIVMLSNYSQFQMEGEAKNAGAIAYLLKINTSPALLASYAKKLFT